MRRKRLYSLLKRNFKVGYAAIWPEIIHRASAKHRCCLSSEIPAKPSSRLLQGLSGLPDSVNCGDGAGKLEVRLAQQFTLAHRGVRGVIRNAEVNEDAGFAGLRTQRGGKVGER
jgi:hypothetical protein